MKVMDIFEARLPKPVGHIVWTNRSGNISKRVEQKPDDEIRRRTRIVTKDDKDNG